MKDLSRSPGEKATQSRYNLMHIAATLEDVISFGGGDPDMATPPDIIRAAFREMARGELTSPTRGLLRLRTAIAEKFQNEKQVCIDAEHEILITNGAQEALFLSIMVLVNPGEHVIVPDPRYSSYDQAIEGAGGEIVIVPTGKNRKFELDADDLRAQSHEGKVLILINPCNPTGAMIPGEEIRRIAEVVRASDLIVISDEIYESLVFDDVPFLSMLQCEGMGERTITLSSFSKTYAMTGFRAGYLIGPEAFIEAAARLKQITSGPCPVFSQYAGLAALKEPQDLAEEIFRIFSGRRKVMMEGLNSLGIPYGHPGGTFFMWADISRFGLSADAFCHRLLMDERVLVFPGTAFGQKWRDYVRISILQSEGRIAEGIERIRSFSESLKVVSAGDESS
jgi:aminotransferase